jgi:hypothetical protein
VAELFLFWRNHRTPTASKTAAAAIDFQQPAKEGTCVDILDLTHEERIALVALVEFLIESDMSASDEELTQINSIVGAFSGGTYRELAAEVDRRISGDDGLREFLTRVERQEARELILEKAIEAAIPDGIRGRESEMLNWLIGEWKVDVDFPDA